MVIGVIVAVAFLPVFNTITNRSLEIDLVNTPWVVFAILGLGTLTGVIAGSYPSFYLSRIRPVKAFKHRFLKAYKGISVRRVLVVSQFMASITLIICSGVIVRQMAFMKQQDPGFERDQIIVIPVGDSDVGGHTQAFKQAILSTPSYFTGNR